MSDAYRLLPFADVLYSCDAKWWDVHADCDGFAGEKWSSHGGVDSNDKIAAAEKHGLRLIQGADREGFSFDPSVIHFGSNSGFQAINLALHFGAKRILLIGFDMTASAGKSHFFGDHPASLIQNRNYERFIPAFKAAAKRLPSDVEIINCTPNSALRCFPMADLSDALSFAD